MKKKATKHTWSNSYFGVSHLKEEPGNPRSATITRHKGSVVLVCWHKRPDNIELGTPGYGLFSDEFTFYGTDAAEKAKKAGEIWAAEAKKPSR